MTAETVQERDAAFLETLAERVRNGTARSWEIPNTVAQTLCDIAGRIQPPPAAPLQVESGGPIPLSPAHEQAIQDWAADDRLWTTQETVAINLRTFARVVLRDAEQPAPLPAETARLVDDARRSHVALRLELPQAVADDSHVICQRVFDALAAQARRLARVDPLPGGSTVARCAARDRHGRGHQASAQVTPLTTPAAVQALMERLDKERKAAKVLASMGNAGARHVLSLLDDMGATIRALVEQDVHYDALANRLVGIGLKEAERRIHGWTLLVRRAEDAEAEVTRLRAALAERRE
jgi:hypothetical protein